MKLYSWNVNGIRAVVRKGELQSFLTKHQPDILCLQETKVDNTWVLQNRGNVSTDDGSSLLRQGVAIATSRSKKTVSADETDSQVKTSSTVNLTAEQGQAEFDASGYEEYWNSSRTKKGYSGTAIFTRIKPIAIINDIPTDIAEAHGLIADKYGHSNDEGRVIAAEFEDFYVVTAYTPNAKDDLTRIPLRQQWDNAMIAYCDALQTKKPVLYCGDMNVAHTEDDLANPKPNRGKKGFTEEERGGFDKWLAAGFVDTFRIFTQGNGHYSWWSHFAKSRERNVGWRIDYWLVSESIADKVKKAEIHADQMGSDHCPVSIELV